MKATMQTTLDTLWTNQVTVAVECEFDNPHTVTAQELSRLMVHRLKFMAEEVRAADRRAAVDPELLEMAQLDRLAGTKGGEPERERQAVSQMERDFERDRDRERARTADPREEEPARDDS